MLIKKTQKLHCLAHTHLPALNSFGERGRKTQTRSKSCGSNSLQMNNCKDPMKPKYTSTASTRVIIPEYLLLYWKVIISRVILFLIICIIKEPEFRPYESTKFMWVAVAAKYASINNRLLVWHPSVEGLHPTRINLCFHCCLNQCNKLAGNYIRNFMTILNGSPFSN